MPLYNPAQEPNHGRWRLPVYLPPTKLDLDLKQIPALPHFSDMQLMLRIGSAQDNAQSKFNADQAVRSYYELAPYHKEYRLGLQPESPLKQPDQESPQKQREQEAPLKLKTIKKQTTRRQSSHSSQSVRLSSPGS